MKKIGAPSCKIFLISKEFSVIDYNIRFKALKILLFSTIQFVVPDSDEIILIRDVLSLEIVRSQSNSNQMSQLSWLYTLQSNFISSITPPSR